MAESKRQRLSKLQVQMELERSSFDAHYRELGDHFAPRRTRFWADDRNRGDKRHNRVVNEAGFLSARTLRSGMFAGITSPARPWRRLSTPDPELADYGPVKDWLFLVNKRMRTMDLRSNLYNVLPTTYGDMGVFAIGAMGVFEDQQDMMRCYSYPVGSYWIARNDRGQVDTFMRKYQMTVRQLVMKFGDVTAGPHDRWKNFSVQVRNAWDRGDYETIINVSHMTTPNMEFDPRKLDAKYSKPYASCYYEQGAVGGSSAQQSDVAYDRFLRESGFDHFPFLVPTWELTGEDIYGTSCPGMEALAGCKELQLTEKRVSRAIEKQLNPALQGPTSLRNQKASLLAGDITYVDDASGKGGLRPIHEVSMAIDKVEQRIERLERRISRCFYEDLFLMLAQMEGIQPRTEAEIAERHEEKLLALGPVLEGTNDALLDPLTDIQFAIMQRFGLVPEPPEELADQDLRVEYESIMAKAQKLVGVAGTERFVSFVGNMAAAFPIVLKKVNALAVVDEYGDMMGVSSQIVRTDEEVQADVEREQAAQQQAQLAERMPVMAGAAKQLSEADTSTDNMLTRLLAGA